MGLQKKVGKFNVSEYMVGTFMHEQKKMTFGVKSGDIAIKG